MKETKKIQKGEFGYLKNKKVRQTLYLLALLLVAVAIFILGLALNKWQVRNIFTIVAILMILPITRVFVSLVILIPYKNITDEDKNVIEGLKRENDDLFYNLVFTSSEHVMHLDALLVTGHQAVGLFRDKKGKREKTEEYFKKEFSARHLDFVYYQAPDLKSFESRLKKRSDNEVLSEKQAADRKEVLEMIRTATV